MPNYDVTGPSNLLTTVEDLARWDRNFDDKTVGGDVALLQMQTPGTLSNGTKSPYGFGLFISNYRGHPTIEHDGRDPGHRSYLIRLTDKQFPDKSFTVACLCNLAFSDDSLPHDLVYHVVDAYLDQLAAAPTSQAPAADAAALRQREDAAVLRQRELGAGAVAYWNSLTASLVQVSAAHDRLCFGPDCAELCQVPQVPNLFIWKGPGGADVLIFPSTGSVPGKLSFTALEDGGRSLEFDELPPPTVAPTDLAGYTGQYYSDEIDTAYMIKLQGSFLEIARHKYMPTTLDPAFRDGFTMSKFSDEMRFGVVRFTRDALGRVNGFLVDGARVRNFQFTKQ
jgi:hypothetical protein